MRLMIASVHFRNFKAIRDAKLDLGAFTLLVGANGSGKSTVLQALQALSKQEASDFERFASLGLESGDDVQLTVQWQGVWKEVTTTAQWRPNATTLPTSRGDFVEVAAITNKLQNFIGAIRIFNLDAKAISQTVGLKPHIELAWNGAQLAAVLDRLRDKEPERFEAVNQELARWIPEFDRILFDTPSENRRAFYLRTRKGRHRISAPELSQGTLLALAMLTLAYLPDPPL